MMKTNRRAFLGAGAVASLSAVSQSALAAKGSPLAPTVADNTTLAASVEADLLRYVGYGIKRAGGAGDTACGEWLAGELSGLGYQVERQTFMAPYFEAHSCDLTCGEVRAELYPQPIVRTTPTGGLSGPLVRVDEAGRFHGSLEGAIALVELAFSRWSTLMSPDARRPIEAAFEAGAAAVVVITNGPTGKVIALNADGRGPIFKGPVALLAPELANPFRDMAMSRATARLRLEGEGGASPCL